MIQGLLKKHSIIRQIYNYSSSEYKHNCFKLVHTYKTKCLLTVFSFPKLSIIQLTNPINYNCTHRNRLEKKNLHFKNDQHKESLNA